MANPQPKEFTRISNELAEAFARHRLSGQEWQVLWVVFRKTYGWHKKEDAISLSQFVEATQKSKRAIIYTLQELEAKNILFVKRNISRGLKDTNTYEFNKNYETWVVQNSAPQAQKNRELAKVNSAKLRKDRGGSAKLSEIVVQNPVKKVNSFAHTKETITKDNTKESKTSPIINYPPNDLTLATLLQERILENTPTFKLRNLETWAEHVRLMREQDNRTEEQIRVIIEWCQNDDFWQANILSTKKLRMKFDQLVAQAKRNINKPTGIQTL